MSFRFIFFGGKRLTNQSTLGAVSTKEFAVPTGKRWLICGGYAERDQNATLNIQAEDASDKIISGLDPNSPYSAGTTNIAWVCQGIVILDETDKVVYDWGAAQTTPEVGLLVLEIDQ